MMIGQPPVRRRLLGTALRRYRVNMGYGLQDAARVLQCDRSKISRIETGYRGISAGELGRLLHEYGVPADEQAALAAIAHHGHDGGWWRDYRDVLPQAAQDLAVMEAAATEIWAFGAHCIPDLLQTEDYARAVADADPAHHGEPERARAVAARLARQAVVLGDRRVRLQVVVTEGAVRQLVGGPDVMRRQLRRLANLGDGDGSPVGDVTVQVLPFDAGAHAVAGAGAVTIVRLSAAHGLGVVHVGGMNGGVCLDAPEDLRRYGDAFALLQVTALPPTASVQLLRDMARALLSQ
jgi:transcriptional regulator with XRE-family HTH domain